MGSEVLMAAQIGMSVISAGAGMGAARAESAAATERSRQEWQEFHRQQEEATNRAREEKSARASEADKLMGQMLAVMADNGGSGTQNESRFAGEIGYLEGLDLAKIEGNRRREVDALKSQQTASAWRALNIISSAGATAQQGIWNIASTAISATSFEKNPATKKGTPPKSGRTVPAPRRKPPVPLRRGRF